MFRNIFKIALRNIVKHKLYSIINIFGLTVGFTAYILISLFLKYEYNWDTVNTNYDRIYRVQVKATLSGKQEYWTQSPPAITDLLNEKYPEFERVILMREAWGEYLSTSTIRPFFDDNGFYADPQIFDVFTYHFIQGDQTKALTEPFAIVLSKTLADKLFPNENAFGKSILLEKKFNLKVTGIYTDLPKSTHVRPSYIISMPTIKTTKNWQEYRSNWGISFRNYVLLKKGVNPKDVDKKIANLINTSHQEPVVQKIYLCPLSKLYLKPTERIDYLVAIYSYSLLAIFILILASINYVNLTTANASMRAKEIAVRKVNGSKRSSLIGQFLGETVILSLLAVNFSLVFANLLLPAFNRIVVKDIDYSYLNNWHFMGYIVIVAIVVGVVSGIYPAFILSSFKPVNLLKSDVFKNHKGKLGPKKVLVAFQYIISIFLIVETIIVYKQMKYMMNKDLGFNKENLLVASISSTSQKLNFEEFRNKLLKNPEILDATFSQNLPFHGNNGWPMNWEGNQSDEKMDVRYNEVSIDYIQALQMKIVMGRDFSRDFPSDREKGCIINETACKRFGWPNPIGKMIEGKFQVVGVVKDFHPYSMHELISPFLIRLKPDETCGNGLYTFRVAPGHITKAKKILTEELEAYFPNDPFEFRIFAEDFRNSDNFRTWSAINNTFVFFTLLIILLAIIGIYGLVSFTASRRTKEIGIRKVHGSSLHAIYFSLIREFLILLAIAVIIAWPMAYTMYQYVPGSYKYGLKLWEFLIATSLVLAITLVTTSYQILKVTLTNPIKALRYE